MEEYKTIIQESLKPQRIGKSEKAYLSVENIAERLNKKDATNIALTGPYGSGKSSILLTLKEDYPGNNYLNVSLATLKPGDYTTTTKEEDKTPIPQDRNKKKSKHISKLNLDRLIEYSILQQLIYKEKQEVLPNSRFKRIFQLPQDKVKYVTYACIGAILAFIVVFEPLFLRVDWIYNLLSYSWLNIFGDTISIVYLGIFSFFAIRLIVPAISNSRLNKLNLKNGEIELVENTSIFNKHLDEILYFFEQTKYNVVILEDLDRFESTDIFIKLRELNLLLNESKVVGRKIVFIYAVRDDMFKDAERVKCFDYVTTVIPVINRSNAKSKLKEELNKRGVTDISDNNLQELGFFLHDMRLLKNIANEYVQYKAKLSHGIRSDKLLGMIVYKNYFPQDFAQLHDCKGIVYRLLNLKEEFVSERIKKIEEDNRRKQELYELHLKERHLKETELRRIYLEAYREKMVSSMQQIFIGENRYNVKDIAANEKLFDKLIEDNNVKYTYIETNSSVYGAQIKTKPVNIPFVDVENAVDPSKKYKDRLAAIRATFNALDNVNMNELKKDDIRALTLSQLMSEIDYSSIQGYKELQVPSLIEYLLAKGYIDENYYDYISYFYGNFIDAHDWDFVLDLKLGKTHEYSYHVNNAEACVKEIPNNVYRKNAILNIDLLDYLATKQEDKLISVKMAVLIRTAIDGKNYKFIAEYFNKGRQQDIVFKQLFSQYKNLWSDFDKNDDEHLSLKQCWFKYAEKEQSCPESQKWLSKNYGFITDHLQEIKQEVWEELINEGYYLFEELNRKSSELLQVIVEANSYTLTKHNVELLIGNLLDMDIDSASYSLVKETENYPLIERVEDDFEQCLSTVFSAPASTKEVEVAILEILKEDNISEDAKVKYLQNQQNKINLEQIEQSVIKQLAIKCNVVEPTWANVTNYLNNVSEKSVDDVILEFIERNVGALSKCSVRDCPEQDERLLLKLLIESDALTIDTYIKILNLFERWNFKGLPKIEERRISLLINKGMVPFRDENTKSLVEGYSGKIVVSYLLKNRKEFLKEPSTVSYNTETALELLKSNLSIKDKATIISFFGKNILTRELANEIIDIQVKEEVTVGRDFLFTVLSLSDKTNDKIVVLNYTLKKNDFSEAELTRMINTLPEPYKLVSEKGKKPELPNNSTVKPFVELLKEKNYISSFSESKHGIRVNTKLK